MPEAGLAWIGLAAVAAAALLAPIGGREEAPVAVAVRPPPLSRPVAPPPIETIAPTPGVSTDGLVLYGISGGGPAGVAAIIGPASGYPRVVPVGGDYRPGLTVKQVGPTHAVLAGGGQETRLDMGRSAGSAGESSAVPAEASRPGFGAVDLTALRLGLRPRRQEGRITGFQLHDAGLPLLRGAGLRQGDVIVAVNGQAFESEEKLLELPQEIAGSHVAEFEFTRDGCRMKSTLPVKSMTER